MASICFLISSVALIYLCILDYVDYHKGRTRRKIKARMSSKLAAATEHMNRDRNGINSDGITSETPLITITGNDDDKVERQRSRKNSIKASPMHLTYPQTSLKLDNIKKTTSALGSPKQYNYRSTGSSPSLPGSVYNSNNSNNNNTANAMSSGQVNSQIDLPTSYQQM